MVDDILAEGSVAFLVPEIILIPAANVAVNESH